MVSGVFVFPCIDFCVCVVFVLAGAMIFLRRKTRIIVVSRYIHCNMANNEIAVGRNQASINDLTVRYCSIVRICSMRLSGTVSLRCFSHAVPNTPARRILSYFCLAVCRQQTKRSINMCIPTYLVFLTHRFDSHRSLDYSGR